MFCRHCGQELPNTAKFCRSCGKPQAVQSGHSEHNAAPAPKASAAIESKARSRLPVATIAGVVVFAAVGGASYWMHAVKVKAEEKAALVAKAAEEAKAAAEKQAEERRLADAKEAEAKVAAANAEADQAKAQMEAKQNELEAEQQKQSASATSMANACSSVNDCVKAMLVSANPRNTEAIQIAATRLAALNQAQRGDRKAARELNKRGLDEFRSGSVDVAIDLLKKANAADPADIEVSSNLLFVVVRGGKLSEIDQAFVNAVLLDPRRTSTWITFAEGRALKKNADAAAAAALLAYEFSGNKEKTIAFLKEQVENPKNEEMKLAASIALRSIEINK